MLQILGGLQKKLLIISSPCQHLRKLFVGMSSLSIEAPYTVASVPKPLDQVRGHSYATPVHSLRKSTKRKRHEIAVGVDGEGVTIHNVRMLYANVLFNHD